MYPQSATQEQRKIRPTGKEHFKNMKKRAQKIRRETEEIKKQEESPKYVRTMVEHK